MAITGYNAQNFLNATAGSLLMPSTYARWLALFTTAPGDNDSGAVEVSAGGYARVQVAGSLATNATTSSSSAVLNFASVPSWIVAGMRIRDATTPAALGTVTVLSTTGTTVTMSANASSTVGSGDTITFSAFSAASSQGPATAVTNAIIAFAQATASWGTVVAFGLYDAVTSGNLWDWDWLGNDPWYPCTITLASPGVITAIGITAGSTPNLANGASVAFTARFGGNVPSSLTSETPFTVAGLSSDTFNVSTNTSVAGAAMVRQVTQQSIPINVTASFASGALTLAVA